MQNITALKNAFASGANDALIKDIYVDETKTAYQRDRFAKAIDSFASLYDATEVAIYSAPGRTEVGGNHTDHQHGCVLAASINLDAIAIVAPTDEPTVRLKSDDYDMITVSLENLSADESEEGTTLALVKGVLSYLREHGYKLGGFDAFVTSDVLIGAGLSSSAAFETIVGTIISGLYNDMTISPVEIAIAGQFAENVYFGKPCGLMDQMASSVGSLVAIDFNNPAEPIVEKVEFDLDACGYSLCIVDTKGSHADLTPEYAAIPVEMKQVAAFFNKDVLRDISLSDLYKNASAIREACGDRALLRAIHFVNENVRAQAEAAALKANDVDAFLSIVAESGRSSFEYLQNVYVSADTSHQNMSVALAVTDTFLGANGTTRVHGGGFAGTIQAFVKNDSVAEYKDLIDSIFGKDSCHVLKIRKYGGMKVID